MNIKLPSEPKWSQEYQTRLNALLENAFAQINQYALVPAGGGNGQVLSKRSQRDFDLTWLDAATGGGGGGDVSALAARLTTVEQTLLTVSADVSAERTARVSGDAALSGQIATLSGTVNANYNSLNTAISNEVSARTSAVAAEAAARASAVSAEATTRANAVSAEATARSNGDATVAANAANASNLTGGTVNIARLPGNVVRNQYGSALITVSTSAPSGGSDGDIWLRIA